MGMFVNVGRTLCLLRALRGKSQSRIAKEAGIGKSQLSKYENGKELPKLDSLEKVLNVLEVGQFEFFYTLQLVDERAAALARFAGAGGRAPGAGSPLDAEPPVPGVPFAPFLYGHPLLEETTDRAFNRVFADLLVLYRRVFEHVVLSSPPRADDAEAS